MEELVDKPEPDLMRQRSLANSSIYIGRIYNEMDRIDEALEEIGKSQIILKHVIESEPDNVPFQRDLALTHHELGRIYERQEDFTMALVQYKADKEISEGFSRGRAPEH